MPKKKFIGELFVEAGLITRGKLDDALNFQHNTQSKQQIGDILVDKGYITEKQLQEVLEFQLGIPFIDLDRTIIPDDMAQLIPVVVARRNKIIPVKISNNKLFIAMADPFNLHAIEDAEMVSKMKVMPLLGKEKSIIQAIDELYGNVLAEKAIEDFKKESNLQDAANDISNIEDDSVGNAPIVRLINSIMEQAVNEGASDIHFEAMEYEVRIRLRVDGTLQQILTTPKKAHAAMIARIKIMGNLNIAEKRIPQDGRCELDILGHNIDIRISTLPTVFGEKAVMRLLDRNSFLKPKNELGFTQENLEKFDLLLKNPHGILLITGPTGSGKSTTLYTMLSELNKVGVNIVTVEDPVEYMIQGINQVQVNPKAKMDFANGLRSILRQDPDIIMIGEIRDQETVEIAIRAAITGHLVLSTIHTNNAPSTISRLLDMGVAPYLLSAAIVGIIAQRLVRKNCPICRKPHTPAVSDIMALGLPEDTPIRFYKGTGCGNCGGSGYKGRMAVHEILTVNNEVRGLVTQEDASNKITGYLKKHGIKTIKDECIRLVQEGVISAEEAIAVAFTQD
ncbi:MAG: GspE/PulE family protein [Saccharofermentanales bacterium]